jgi:acetoin utilization deacetylase AcuC-like enzyme
MTTAYVTHPNYVLHTLEGHPEHAGRLERIWQVLDTEGVAARMTPVKPASATPEQLALVHEPGYVQFVEKAARDGGGMLDPDTYLLPVSYDVACLATGGVLSAVDAVCVGEARNAFAAVRPPGHHATSTRAMGFCVFNNIAVGARYAQKEHAIGRVMIVDFDVHHGNGTQDAFYSDPSVLYVSTHQYPHYPGTGTVNETGAGDGVGTNINMPLPAGVGNEGFKTLYERVLWPAARRFAPDLIMVSAGFDAHWSDPLAMLQLDLNGFAHLARQLRDMADELCEGRLIYTLEGGYDLDALGYGVLNVCKTLLGDDDVVDPIGEAPMPGRPTDDLVARLIELHGLE